MWYQTFDAVFFMGVLTAFVTVIVLIVKKCAESRCDQCSVCYGLCIIHRQVELENEERELQLTHNQTTDIESTNAV